VPCIEEPVLYTWMTNVYYENLSMHEIRRSMHWSRHVEKRWSKFDSHDWRLFTRV